MTLRFCLALLSLLIISDSSLCQTYDQLKIQNQFEGFYGSKARNNKIYNERLGSEYLIDEWHKITVHLKEGQTDFDQSKINIHDGTVEIIYKGEEKYISGRYIDYLEVYYQGKLRKMIPAENFTEKGKKLRGFLEIVREDEPAVFVYHQTYLRKPNPHANIAGGYTVDRLMKISKNCIYDGQSIHIINNTKDIKKLYQQQKTKIDELIKVKSLDMDQAEDIATLLQLLQV